MQGLKLFAPPLCAQEDLPSSLDLPLSPPTPPKPLHQFPEAANTTVQEEIRAAVCTGTHVGPRVLCTVIHPHKVASLPSVSVLHSSGRLVILNW